ncbi:MAG: glutathione S-transferase N-terminal domain-containing protein [Myxococcales bacterium]|nr:glutathione S-transferase N-terminal domain-containing protein [Myxococcales bacterium]
METRPTPARVAMYSTLFCPYCAAAKLLLRQLGIAYDDVDVTANPSARRELRERTGHRTVPVIFVDGTFVGGYVELRALWRRGELDALRATA